MGQCSHAPLASPSKRPKQRDRDTGPACLSTSLDLMTSEYWFPAAKASPADLQRVPQPRFGALWLILARPGVTPRLALSQDFQDT